MKRRQRHWANPKNETKITTERKRTICTTLDNQEDRRDFFDPVSKSKRIK